MESDRLWGAEPKFESRQGQEIFLFSTESQPALGQIEPRIQLVPGVLFLREEGPRGEADNTPTSSAHIKNRGAISLLLHRRSRHGDDFYAVIPFLFFF
jgi:hypothetical protein